MLVSAVKPDLGPGEMTLAEVVEETKGKLHIKERDANAFYESSEVKKMRFEELIAQLRRENKRKRVLLAECIRGDETVIRSAFHQRRVELLSMQRFTSDKAIDVMDQKVSEGKKRLNAQRFEKRKRETLLQELRDEVERLNFINTTDFNACKEQEIRRIQNEMDKALIKVNAAHNITRRYQAIMDSLQQEVRNYPAILDSLEKEAKRSSEECCELCNMKDKAVHAAQEATQDLRTMEREMYQAKRARDQQLNEMKKEVEKRKEVADRSDKRQKIALISDTSADMNKTKQQMEKVERQEKILTLEDAFQRIMQATHVSDIEDIIYRLDNQDRTYKQLRSMEKEKTFKKNIVSEELSKLKAVFEDIKFNSERLVQSGRKAVENMAEYLNDQDARHTVAVDTYIKNNALLLNLQSGIATLLEKLKEVRLKPPFHNFTKGDAVEDLKQCGRKLDLLLTNLCLKKSLCSQKVDTEMLHHYLEAKLPVENIRIRLDYEDNSDDDEFHFDHDQDNDGFISRDDIKRQGQEILNSKLKPKRKKSRKRNN